jgi:hypothetical protein
VDNTPSYPNLHRPIEPFRCGIIRAAGRRGEGGSAAAASVACRWASSAGCRAFSTSWRRIRIVPRRDPPLVLRSCDEGRRRGPTGWGVAIRGQGVRSGVPVFRPPVASRGAPPGRRRVAVAVAARPPIRVSSGWPHDPSDRYKLTNRDITAIIGRCRTVSPSRATGPSARPAGRLARGLGARIDPASSASVGRSSSTKVYFDRRVASLVREAESEPATRRPPSPASRRLGPTRSGPPVRRPLAESLWPAGRSSCGRRTGRRPDEPVVRATRDPQASSSEDEALLYERSCPPL